MTQKLAQRNRGLSAFAGVVIVVMTTMLLIGTAAVFFSDYSLDTENQQETPSAELAVDYVASEGNESIELTHEEGDPVRPAQMNVTISGAECTGNSDPNGNYNAQEDLGLTQSNWFSSGNLLELDQDAAGGLCQGGTLTFDDAEITVVWHGPDGKAKETLERWSA